MRGLLRAATHDHATAECCERALDFAGIAYVDRTRFHSERGSKSLDSSEHTRPRPRSQCPEELPLASRSARSIRAGDQPQDCQGARPHCVAAATRWGQQVSSNGAAHVHIAAGLASRPPEGGAARCRRMAKAGPDRRRALPGRAAVGAARLAAGVVSMTFADSQISPCTAGPSIARRGAAGPCATGRRWPASKIGSCGLLRFCAFGRPTWHAKATSWRVGQTNRGPPRCD